jgi:phosphoribosylformimino-5-aminoimidazole carboxamide ribotide isomerase
MRIYPVIDLLGGVVVRGVGGDRDNYRPIQSRIAPSSAPIDVARAFREQLGLAQLYVADLDAIQGGAPSSEAVASLAEDGFRLLVDRGVRSAAEARAALQTGASDVVAALETLPDPGALSDVLAACGADRVVFSLDMKDGKHLGDGRGWPQADPWDVAQTAWQLGVRRMLILDLRAVGRGGGPAHLDFLRRLARDLDGLEVLTGGGVRSVEDLSKLAEAGVDGVLVASALHDGAITRSGILGISS